MCSLLDADVAPHWPAKPGVYIRGAFTRQMGQQQLARMGGGARHGARSLMQASSSACLRTPAWQHLCHAGLLCVPVVSCLLGHVQASQAQHVRHGDNRVLRSVLDLCWGTSLLHDGPEPKHCANWAWHAAGLRSRWRQPWQTWA